jgi:hypothetical protein
VWTASRADMKAGLRDFAGPQSILFLNPRHLVDDVQNHPECRSYSFSQSAAQGNIAASMKYSPTP